MALTKNIISRVPVIIVIGATGTGKTKLGIELAQRFNSEIISADSMQLYKGLDIITAKASPEEQKLAKHHIIDILEPHQTFTVVDFRNRALKIIEKLMSENRPPIIVGGTAYYAESITWNTLVENLGSDQELLCETDKKRALADQETGDSAKKAKIEVDEKGHTAEDVLKMDLKELFEKIEGLSSELLHVKLTQIDPEMADRLHPNNRRKIIRAIEVFRNTGKKHSTILDEQQDKENKLRFPDNTIVLWLSCEQSVHDARLSSRIDKMLADGLLQELTEFHENYNRQRMKDGNEADYTKGVFQTIGFRSFHSYLILDEEAKKSDEGKKILEACIAKMKLETIRYSKRQNKMIRGRFLDHPRREIPMAYQLDVTHLEKWSQNVTNKAISIIESFIEGKEPDYEQAKPSKSAEANKLLNSKVTYNCDVCQRLFIGDVQYGNHMNSKKHEKMVKKTKINN